MENIQIEYIDETNLIPKTYVKFKLNNKLLKGYFLIDLGSDISIIFNKYSLNSKEINSELLCIGNIGCKESVNFQVLNPNKTPLFDSFSGILGLSFLSKNNLKIDFKLMKLSFNVTTINNKFLLPVFFIEKYLILKLKLKDKAFNFLYDTGSSYDLIFFENRSNKLENDSALAKSENSEGLSANDYKILQYDNDLNLKFKSFQLKTNLKIMKENKMSIQVPKNINGIIGNKMFFDKQIVIDYKNQEFYTIKQ